MTGALAHHAATARRAGRFGDTHLVHLNPGELATLDRLWGRHTLNPDTGLPEYFDILGALGDVAGAIGSGVSSLFGGSSGSGIGNALGSVGSLLASLLGGGPAGPATGAGGSSSMFGLPMSNNGGSGTPQSTSGGVRTGGPSWLDLLHLASGAASVVGGITQNNAYQRQQHKLQKQQKRQYRENNQHVDYGIGSPTNIVYGLKPQFPTELSGFNPEQALTSRTDPHYRRGGPVRMADGGRLARMGPLARGALSGRHMGGWAAGMGDRPDRPDRVGGGAPYGPPDPSDRDFRRLASPATPAAAPAPAALGAPAAAADLPVGQSAATSAGSIFDANLAGFGPAQRYNFARGGKAAVAGMALPPGALSHPAGQVPGGGTGQSDEVPAYLSKDEYVVPADVVSHLGDGSSGAGAKKMDKLVSHVRKKRTGNSKFPPRMGGLNQMKQLMGGV